MCYAFISVAGEHYPSRLSNRAKTVLIIKSKSLFVETQNCATFFMPPTPCAPACLPDRAFGYAALRQNYVLLFSMVCGIVYVLQK